MQKIKKINSLIIEMTFGFGMESRAGSHEHRETFYLHAVAYE